VPRVVLVPRDERGAAWLQRPSPSALLADLNETRARRHVARAAGVGLSSAALQVLAPQISASMFLEAPEPQDKPEIIHAVQPGGPTLVQLPADMIDLISRAHNGIDVVPVVGVRPAVVVPSISGPAPGVQGKGHHRFKVKVVSAASGRPLQAARVRAVLDARNAIGSEATTDAQGVATVDTYDYSRIEILVVYPQRSCWTRVLRQVSCRGPSIRVPLRRLSSDPDILRLRYPHSELGDGAGVRVGVVDTGVGPHPHLEVSGGRNVVLTERPVEWQSNGNPHGTHVAGIIAGRAPRVGRRGLAPGVAVYSIRAYPEGSGYTDTVAVADAIRAAIDADCDLINLSLTLDDPRGSRTVEFMVNEARRNGAVVIAAAGNGGRRPVGFPAANQRVIAVSALGRHDVVPEDVGGAIWSCTPHGTDPSDFVASFSNAGPEMDCSAPGVAIVSTVQGGYADMDGTSMAAPCVTAIAARWLAASDLLAAPRNAERADAIATLVRQAGRTLGFPRILEGRGLVSLPPLSAGQ